MNPKELFKEGYNCAQSVFVPIAVAHNIDKSTALKIMAPYGGGIAKTDNLCGAVTGGITAIGLHYGHIKPGDLETKQKCNAATQRFLTAFEEKHKSLHCTKLLGYNLSKESENEEAVESGVFDTKCPDFVESAHKLAKEIIDELT